MIDSYQPEAMTTSFLNHPFSKFSVLLQFLAGISIRQVEHFDTSSGHTRKIVITNITSSPQGIFMNNTERSKPTITGSTKVSS